MKPRIKEEGRLYRVLLMVFILSFLLFHMPLFATANSQAGDETGASPADETDNPSAAEAGNSSTDETPEADSGESPESNTETATETSNPVISTVVSVRDILLDESFASNGTEDSPAFAEKYTEYAVDPEIEEKIVEQELRVEKAAEEQAKKEAAKLAAELVENGRYIDVIGEESAYEKGWAEADEEADAEDVEYDDSDYDSESEDIYDEGYEDTEYIHSDDSYFSGLEEKYPAILMFWFDENGNYYYDYDVDYGDIDYDSMYYEILHDTFEVTDELKYEGLTAGGKYSVHAKLIQLEVPETYGMFDDVIIELPSENAEKADEETEADTPEYSEKKVVKEIWDKFIAGDGGNGAYELKFGEHRLDYGRYVVIVEIYDASNNLIAAHNDLSNNSESIVIGGRLVSASESKAAVKGTSARGAGSVSFPEESKIKGARSPQTGDDEIELMIIYSAILLISITCLIGCALSRRNDV